MTDEKVKPKPMYARARWRPYQTGDFMEADFSPPEGWEFDGLMMYPGIFRVRVRKEADE